MPDLISTAFRSLLAIVTLFLLARLLGKKQISQLSFFDYVAGISIGSVAGELAVDGNIGLAQGLEGMVVFAGFTLLLNLVSLKSYRGRKLLDGKPSILIQHGEILEKSLKKARLTVNDLMEECRLKGVFEIEDVDYAIFETKGEVSILLKPDKLPLTPAAMGIPASGIGLCTNVVIDGRVLADNLALLGKDERWLNAELSKINKGAIEHQLLCCVDGNGALHAFEKGDHGPPASLI